MKNTATILISLTLALVGIGGFIHLKELEKRVLQLESSLAIATAEATTAKIKEPESQPLQTLPAQTTNPVMADPLGSPDQARSYLQELLELTQRNGTR